MTRAVPMPKNRHKKRAIRQGRFLRAYARTGTVYGACRVAGVTQAVVQDWMDWDPTLKLRCEAAWGKFADSLMGRLLTRADEGHGPSLHLLARIVLTRQGGLIPTRPHTRDFNPWVTDEEINRDFDVWDAQAERKRAAAQAADQSSRALAPVRPP